MKKFVELLTKVKLMIRSNGKMMKLTFIELYAVYIVYKINNTFVYIYLLICLNKDTSVLLKLIKI